FIFFFQAEDGIRDRNVTGVQTCALPISVAVIILRKREPELKRPFKVPWYPIIPIISVIGGIFIVVSTIINQFVLSIIGIGLTLLGLPTYYYMQKKNN